MRLGSLWLTDFRNYQHAELTFAPGLTAVVGDNGQGKTNLLEAIAFCSLQESFRGAPAESLVRQGASRAIVRADVDHVGRPVLIEAEVAATRTRVQVNRQRVARARDLLDALRVSVFTPDDLALVKGGPGERRRWIDETLVALHARHDQARLDLERVLKQRNALLRQIAGMSVDRLSGDDRATLDVWDERLASIGTAVAVARRELLARLEPTLQKAYDTLAREPSSVRATYACSWGEIDLASAIARARTEELRRGLTLVGPHRDDIELSINGLPARSHASQGEQRSLTLAMRLAVHDMVTDVVGLPPVVLLDDVLSELDPGRSAALLGALPDAQVVVTTAGVLPDVATIDAVMHVREGMVVVHER